MSVIGWLLLVTAIVVWGAGWFFLGYGIGSNQESKP